MRRVVVALLAVALVASGCGKTYSVEETRAALDAAGVRSERSDSLSLTLEIALGDTSDEFPPPELAVGELLFDVPRIDRPVYATGIGESQLIVFRGTHDAWAAQQTFALAKRQLTEDALRRVPREVRPLLRLFATARTIRHGNVLIVLRGRDPQLEAVASRLP